MSNDLNDTSRSAADLELVMRAQEGDPDAFAALFSAHKARVYSICLRMTNNTAQTEDLTQDAFLQVFRKLSTFRGNSISKAKLRIREFLGGKTEATRAVSARVFSVARLRVF